MGLQNPWSKNHSFRGIPVVVMGTMLRYYASHVVGALLPHVQQMLKCFS